MNRPLAELMQSEDFVRRHIGPDDADIAHMLEVVGVGSLDELLTAAVPDTIRLADPLDMHGPATESAVLDRLRAIAGKNKVYRSMIGIAFFVTVSGFPGVHAGSGFDYKIFDILIR